MSSAALFLSVAEVAELLAVSDDLVYDLIARRQLPATTVGRLKRVPRRAVELVVERSLAGFDPDVIVSRLAGATGPSSADGTSPPSLTVVTPPTGSRGEGSLGPAETEAHASPPHVPRKARGR